MAQKTLLELSTEAPERSCIKIDNNLYELKVREDLGLKEDAEFTGMYAEFQAAMDAKDWRSMGVVLDKMVQGVVLGVPADVLAKLNDQKKLQIVQAFIKEIGVRPAPISLVPVAA